MGRAAAELCAAPASLALQTPPTLDIAQLDPDGGSPRLSAHHPAASFQGPSLRAGGSNGGGGSHGGGGTPHSGQLGALFAAASLPAPRSHSGSGGRSPSTAGQHRHSPPLGSTGGDHHRRADAPTAVNAATATAGRNSGGARESGGRANPDGGLTATLAAGSAVLPQGALPSLAPISCRAPPHRQAGGHASGSGGSSNSPDAAAAEAEDDGDHQSPSAPGSPPPHALGHQLQQSPDPQQQQQQEGGNQEQGRPHGQEQQHSQEYEQQPAEVLEVPRPAGETPRDAKDGANISTAQPANDASGENAMAGGHTSAPATAPQSIAAPQQSITSATAAAAAVAEALTRKTTGRIAADPMHPPSPSAPQPCLPVAPRAIAPNLLTLVSAPASAPSVPTEAPFTPTAVKTAAAVEAKAASNSPDEAPTSASRPVPGLAPLQLDGAHGGGGGGGGGFGAGQAVAGLSPRASGSFTSSGQGAFKKYASPTCSGEEG